MPMPQPHLEKLNATLANTKLPAVDKPRVQAAIERYGQWLSDLNQAISHPSEDLLAEMVRLMNDYKTYVDVDLIFDSTENFLYRQKGQLKLDNSIIEEFLPWLVRPPLVSNLGDDVFVGPKRCFSAIYFMSGITRPERGGGLKIRAKDQDFTVSRRLYVRTSHREDFASFAQDNTYLAYIAAEMKTNLDKTMFQEACATAHDVKSAVPGSKYYLICEWLDMTPLSTAPTDIDEALIMRKAKRVNSNVRKHFSTSAGRQDARAMFTDYLSVNPLRVEVFQRLLDHINGLLDETEPVEADVLEQGFF